MDQRPNPVSSASGSPCRHCSTSTRTSCGPSYGSPAQHAPGPRRSRPYIRTAGPSPATPGATSSSAEREIGILADKAQAGVTVRICLGEPDSPHIAERGAEEGIDDAMGAKIRNALTCTARCSTSRRPCSPPPNCPLQLALPRRRPTTGQPTRIRHSSRPTTGLPPPTTRWRRHARQVSPQLRVHLG